MIHAAVALAVDIVLMVALMFATDLGIYSNTDCNDRLCSGNVYPEPPFYEKSTELQESMERSLSQTFPGIPAYGSCGFSYLSWRVLFQQQHSRRQPDRPYTIHWNRRMYIFPGISADFQAQSRGPCRTSGRKKTGRDRRKNPYTKKINAPAAEKRYSQKQKSCRINQNRKYYTFYCSVCAALSLWSQSYARQIRIKCINISEV